jgi:hypothetical protein
VKFRYALSAAALLGALCGTAMSGTANADVLTTSYSDWLAHAAGTVTNTTSITGIGDFTPGITSIPLGDGTSLAIGTPGGDTAYVPGGLVWGPWTSTITPGLYGGLIFDTSNNTETLTLAKGINALGFEVQPDEFAHDTITATLSDGTSTTIGWNNAPGVPDPAVTQFIGFYGGPEQTITISFANAPDFSFGNFVDAVPEPASLLLLAGPLAALGWLRRRAKR